MYDVVEGVKDLFAEEGHRKNIRIHFPDGECSDIINTQIVEGSVRFTESLCQRDELKLGLNELSTFECEIVGAPNISDAAIEVSAEANIDMSVQAYKEQLHSTVYKKKYDEIAMKIHGIESIVNLKTFNESYDQWENVFNVMSTFEGAGSGRYEGGGGWGGGYVSSPKIFVALAGEENRFKVTRYGSSTTFLGTKDEGYKANNDGIVRLQAIAYSKSNGALSYTALDTSDLSRKSYIDVREAIMMMDGNTSTYPPKSALLVNRAYYPGYYGEITRGWCPQALGFHPTAAGHNITHEFSLPTPVDGEYERDVPISLDPPMRYSFTDYISSASDSETREIKFTPQKPGIDVFQFVALAKKTDGTPECYNVSYTVVITVDQNEEIGDYLLSLSRVSDLLDYRTKTSVLAFASTEDYIRASAERMTEEYVNAMMKHVTTDEYGNTIVGIPYGRFKIISCSRTGNTGTHKNIMAISSGINTTSSLELYKKNLVTSRYTAYTYDLAKAAFGCLAMDSEEVVSDQIKNLISPSVYRNSRFTVSESISKAIPSVSEHIKNASMSSVFIRRKKLAEYTVKSQVAPYRESTGFWSIALYCVPICVNSMDRLFKYTSEWCDSSDVYPGDITATGYTQLLDELRARADDAVMGNPEKYADECKSVLDQYLYMWCRPFALLNGYSTLNKNDRTARVVYYDHNMGYIYPNLSISASEASDIGIVVAVPFAASIDFDLGFTDGTEYIREVSRIVRFKKNINGYTVASPLFDKYTVTLPRVSVSNSTNRYVVDTQDDNIGSDLMRLLGDLMEIQGKTGKITRLNTLDFFKICSKQALYPAIDIYPDPNLYPAESVEYFIPKSQIVKDSAIFSEKSTNRYRFVLLTYIKTVTTDEGDKQEEVTLIYDIEGDKFSSSLEDEDEDGMKYAGMKVYDLSSNLILTELKDTSDDTRKAVMKTVGEALKEIRYTPGEVEVRGMPFLEAGDFVSVHIHNRLVTTVILAHTLSGEKSIVSNISSN